MKQVIRVSALCLLFLLVQSYTDPCSSYSNAQVTLTSNSGTFGCSFPGDHVNSEWIINPNNGSILLTFDTLLLSQSFDEITIIDGPYSYNYTGYETSIPPYTSYYPTITVKFISTQSLASSFQLSYVALGDPCLYSVNATVVYSTLSCPDVGASVTSSWVLLEGSPVSLTVVQNGNFQLTVRDGPSASSAVLYSESFIFFSGILYSSQSALYVTLTSSGRGGIFTITTQPNDPCFGDTSILTASSGDVRCGPNASTGQGSGQVEIVGDHHSLIQLTFNQIQLAGSDQVVVADGTHFLTFTSATSSVIVPSYLSFSFDVNLLLFIANPSSVIDIGYQLFADPCNSASVITLTANTETFGCQIVYAASSDHVSGWLITPANGGAVTLTFSSNSFVGGHLVVYDGKDNTAGVLYTAFAQTISTSPIYASGAAMFVQLTSSYYQSYTFTALYRSTVLLDPCVTSANASRFASAGSISCPAIIDTNQQTVTSYWAITPAEGLITLLFSNVNLEPGFDTLNIYNDVSNPTLIATLTSTSTVPKVLISSSFSVLVELIVTGTGTKRSAPYSFTITYTTAGSPCDFSNDVLITAESGSIGCTNGIAKDIVSTWLIAPHNGQIQYAFADFFLSPYGYGDYLNLYDGINATQGRLINSFTGFNLPPSGLTITDTLFVELISNNYYDFPFAGFVLNYATLGDICGTSTSVTLINPKGVFGCSGGLANNVLSSWLIEPDNSIIALVFLKFNLEDGYDFLAVFDGPTPNSPLLGNFTGAVVPSAVFSTQSSVLVLVQTDASIESAGFEIAYTSGLGDPCLSNYNETFTTPTGQFGCPNGVQNNITSTWNINVPPSEGVIVAAFTQFSLELDYDFLYVYDGATTHDRLIATLTGSTLPPNVRSSGQSLTFELVTDSEVRSQGFFVQYSSLQSNPCESSQLVTLTANSQSFGCTNGIANSITSSWLLTPADHNIITLTFSVFNLRVNDFVRVYDGSSTSATLLGSFTGTLLPSLIVSSGPTLLVVLSTDAVNPSTGFRATYTTTTADPCLTSQEVTVTTSSGSFGCPNGVYSNVQSEWLIAPLSNNLIVVTVEFLDLASGGVLYVFDGSTSTAPLLATLTGTARGSSFYTTTSVALVVVATGSSGASNGFVVDFVTAIPPSPSVNPLLPSASRSPIDFSFTSSLSPLPPSPSASPASITPFAFTATSSKSVSNLPSLSRVVGSFAASLSAAPTPSVSGTVATSSVGASATATVSPSPVILFSIKPFSPSPYPSVTASALPLRITTDVETVLVELTCKSSGSICCNNFQTVWGTEVAQNYPNLITVNSCVYNNGNVTVTFLQYGSNYFTSDEILLAYWKDGGCKSLNPLSGTPCNVTGSTLTTTIWNVKLMEVTSLGATPSALPTYYYYAPPSSSSILSAFSALVILAISLLFL